MPYLARIPFYELGGAAGVRLGPGRASARVGLGDFDTWCCHFSLAPSHGDRDNGLGLSTGDCSSKQTSVRVVRATGCGARRGPGPASARFRITMPTPLPLSTCVGERRRRRHLEAGTCRGRSDFAERRIRQPPMTRWPFYSCLHHCEAWSTSLSRFLYRHGPWMPGRVVAPPMSSSATSGR